MESVYLKWEDLFFCKYMTVRKADTIWVMNNVTKKSYFYIFFEKLLEQVKWNWMGLENVEICLVSKNLHFWCQQYESCVRQCVRNSGSGLPHINHKFKKWWWRHNFLTRCHCQFFWRCCVSLITFCYWVTLHVNIIIFFKYMISLNQCYKSTKSVRNTKLNRSYMQIIFNDIFCLHLKISQTKPFKIIELTEQDSAKQFR